MKKIFKCLITLVTILALVSCNEQQPHTSTETSQVSEATLINIEASNTNEEYCYVGDVYHHSPDVIIYAIYSDSSKVNVTNLASFSTINTDVEGSRLVSVSYQGKITNYSVNVKKPISDYLEIDTTNIRQTYFTGEKIDLSNLKVKVHYTNNTVKEINNYSYDLTDSYNYPVNPFEIDRVGRIDVRISYDNISTSFELFSIGNYDVSYTMRYQALDELYDTSLGYYEFQNEDNIYKTQYMNIYANDTTLSRVDTQNNPITEKYNTVEYFEGLTINKDSGLKFVLTHDAIVSFLVRGESNTNILISEISSEETQSTKFQSIDFDNKLKLISTHLRQGIYQLTNMEGVCYLLENNVYISDSTVETIRTFRNLELELKNVKKEFVDEPFNYDNLYVKGVYENGSYKSIEPKDYKVELIYNDSIVNSFKLSGDYLVKVTYIGQNPTLDFVTSYLVKYTNSKQHSENQFEELTINGKSVEFGHGQNADIVGSVTIDTASKAVVRFKLLDPQNSSLYIDGVLATNLMELDLTSSEQTFEFSVEYKDSQGKTIYYIKYLVTIKQ